MSVSSPKELIRELKRKPEAFYIVHYSCQSLYDDNEGLSPRITSIAIVHFSTDQSISFSTHAVAEELNIKREDVQKNFDAIETQLLENFYEFIAERRDKYWLHWNMRSLAYGFEHLEHRYRCLTEKNAPVVPVERRVNINDMLAMRYGSDYADHPRMQSIMEINGGINRDFLAGKDELEAFKNEEYIKMHKSVLTKVGFFRAVLRKMSNGKLKTKSSGFGQILDNLYESRTAKMIGLIASIFAIPSLIIGIISITQV